MSGSPTVSIVIPSFRRPAMLRGCLRACMAQDVWQGGLPGEILVVDNSPEGSARPALEGLEDGPVPLRYVQETRPGISHARNTGLREASGRLIAFIDDDNLPSPSWLSALIATREALGADAVFGRVVSLPTAPCTGPEAELAVLYARDLGPEPRLVTEERAVLGTGNSLFLRDRCFTTPEPFDPALGLTGGEDTALLSHLAGQGRALGWAPTAMALELVPLDRLTRHSLCARRFRNGSIRVRYGQDGRAAGLGHRLRWMAIGAAQAALLAAGALAYRLAGQRGRADLAWGGVYGGLGKLFWWRGLQASYGQEPAAKG